MKLPDEGERHEARLGGTANAARARQRSNSRTSGGAGWDERAHAASVRTTRQAAQSISRATHLSDAAESVHGRLALDRQPARARSSPAGHDPVRAIEGTPRWSLRGRSVAHAASPDCGVAGAVRSGPRGDLSPDPRARRSGAVRLHLYEQPGRDAGRRAVPAPGLPPGAGVLERRGRPDLL